MLREKDFHIHRYHLVLGPRRDIILILNFSPGVDISFDVVSPPRPSLTSVHHHIMTKTHLGISSLFLRHDLYLPIFPISPLLVNPDSGVTSTLLIQTGRPWYCIARRINSGSRVLGPQLLATPGCLHRDAPSLRCRCAVLMLSVTSTARRATCTVQHVDTHHFNLKFRSKHLSRR